MSQNQLNLFSQQSEKLAVGYGKLSAFSFDEAKKIFREIVRSYTAAEEEVYDALDLNAYWKKILLQCDVGPISETGPVLYNEVDRYPFKESWGMQLFRASLIDYLIKRMRQSGIFYLTEEVCLSDLLLERERYEAAELTLKKHLEEEGHQPLRYRLAQVQWRTGNQKEANKNVVLAFLHDPVNLPFTRIENEETRQLVRMYGGEMAPAYGWIEGKLPLIRIPDSILPLSERHARAVSCYRLLRSAEKAVRKKEMEKCVYYRKQLKEEAPELYDAYFRLLEKRQY